MRNQVFGLGCNRKLDQVMVALIRHVRAPGKVYPDPPAHREQRIENRLTFGTTLSTTDTHGYPTEPCGAQRSLRQT